MTTTAPMPTPQELGYDPPTKTGGKYLKLENKGDSVRIRIVSRPFRFEETFEDKEKGETKSKAQWAWTVIHKELVDGKPVKTVKAFKAGPMVYGLIYDLVNSPDWGDPTLYDIQITRTEEKGKYYAVNPLPRPIGPLSEPEQQMVTDAKINLAAMFTHTEETSDDSMPGDEDDPFADEE